MDIRYYLKYVGNEPIRTSTIDGKREVQPWEVFATDLRSFKSLLSLYSKYFKQVELLPTDNVLEPVVEESVHAADEEQSDADDQGTDEVREENATDETSVEEDAQDGADDQNTDEVSDENSSEETSADNSEQADESEETKVELREEAPAKSSPKSSKQKSKTKK